MTDEVVTAPATEGAPATEVASVESAAPSISPVEQRARSQGWVPKEEWTGDEAAWRPADVYVDRGELLGKIKSQSTELREVKGMIAHVTEQNRKLYEAGYQKAISDLESQRDTAIEEGNARAVRELDKQIKAHTEALEATSKPVVVAGTSDAVAAAAERFETFKQSNPWYEKDETLQDWANGAAVKFKGKNRNATDTEIYEFLTKEVRAKYPEKFKRVGAPSPDGKSDRGAGSPAGKSSGASGFDAYISELPEMEAQIARNLVKRGHVTKEKYMENITAIGGLKR
jgi:hypothetical protein